VIVRRITRASMNVTTFTRGTARTCGCHARPASSCNDRTACVVEPTLHSTITHLISRVVSVVRRRSVHDGATVIAQRVVVGDRDRFVVRHQERNLIQLVTQRAHNTHRHNSRLWSGDRRPRSHARRGAWSFEIDSSLTRVRRRLNTLATNTLTSHPNVCRHASLGIVFSCVPQPSSDGCRPCASVVRHCARTHTHSLR
jgi:hypothetical protein